MKKKRLDELGRIDPKTFKEKPKAPAIFILDNIRSALNVGSAFRTSDAFRIEQLILCGITATPPHKEIIKTAIGATASVEWTYVHEVKEAIYHCREKGFKIIGVEQTSDSISLQDWKAKKKEQCAFIFGNEVDGISDEALPALDLALEIPQFGTKHSFNVAVSMGIIGWHYFYHARPFE